MSMTYIWLGVMILMLLIEAAVPGLVSIWFAAGALVSVAASALRAPLWLQLLLFVMVSVVSLIVTRPLVKKYVNSKVQPTNADAIIGREGVVTEKIDNVLGAGAVKVGGTVWSALSSSDDITIEPGTRIIAEEIRGVKLVVRPL